MPREEKRPARQSSSSAFGVAVVLFALAGAVLLFLLTRKPAPEAPPAAEAVSPFADLPPEAPPEKQAKTKGEQQREGNAGSK
jgi:hypothetical protein